MIPAGQLWAAAYVVPTCLVVSGCGLGGRIVGAGAVGMLSVGMARSDCLVTVAALGECGIPMSPYRPFRACVHPGCVALVTSGSRCERHRLPEKPRPTAAERGYDSQWQATRARYLRRYPYCAACGQPATDVHHIQGRAAGDDDDNLLALCHSCHSSTTRRAMNARRG